MRILLAHKLFHVTGGAEVFFRETERVLRENGHQTMMVATGDRTADCPDNLELMQAPNYLSGGVLRRAANLPRAIYDRQKKRQMARIIAKFKPDIVHVFAVNVHLSPSIIVAAHEAGIPVVGSFNDYKHICPNYKLYHHQRLCDDCLGGKFHRAISNTCCNNSRALSVASALEAYVHRWLGIYRRFSHFTFSSDFMARETARFWPERTISWSKLRNPYDSPAQTAQNIYDPYGLYFGRLIGEKGVDQILDAAPHIDDFPIRIIGDGPDFERLKQRAKDERLANIEFLGPLWNDALMDILARARFVVIPSLWHENFPYVINQSFAAGRPVIGADRGGIPEMVADMQRGLVFEPNQPRDLARKIKLLSSNDALARQMGRDAKIWSDNNFNDSIFVNEVIKAYQTALKINA